MCWKNNGHDHSWAQCRAETEEQRGFSAFISSSPPSLSPLASDRVLFAALLLLRSCAGLWWALGTFLAFLLDPVHVEGFVLECYGEQGGVSRCVRLDGLAKSRVGGGDEVWLILSWSVHDLMVQENEPRHHQYQEWQKADTNLLKVPCIHQYITNTCIYVGILLL